jgi:hypothetical protein
MLLIYQIGYNNKALNILCNVVYATLGLKLVGVARASLEELLPDYNDFLRQPEKQFLDQGGFTETLYRARQNARKRF